MFGTALQAVGLTSRQKAAVIVRLVLGDGNDLDLSTLPSALQAELAQEMALMGLVDKQTRDSIVDEFCTMLDDVGLSFPGGIDGTLDLLDGHLSQDTADRLRRMAALSGVGDPWVRIAALSSPILAELARTEAVEIAAVMFSKLPVPRAAEIFGQIAAERARQIAFAMSLIGDIDAAALRRIGHALIQAADSVPSPALEGKPVEKVGAILNFSPSATRDTVLAGLDDDDAEFAGHVRKAIFTWANIPARIDPRDISRITREVEGVTLLKALAGSQGKNLPTAQFLLGGMSTRLADSTREEMEALGKVATKDAEEAMDMVVAAIRRMETAGDLFLIAGEAEEDQDNPAQTP